MGLKGMGGSHLEESELIPCKIKRGEGGLKMFFVCFESALCSV